MKDGAVEMLKENHRAVVWAGDKLYAENKALKRLLERAYVELSHCEMFGSTPSMRDVIKDIAETGIPVSGTQADPVCEACKITPADTVVPHPEDGSEMAVCNDCASYRNDPSFMDEARQIVTGEQSTGSEDDAWMGSAGDELNELLKKREQPTENGAR